MRLLVERIRSLIRRRELKEGRVESEPIIERGDLYGSTRRAMNAVGS